MSPHTAVRKGRDGKWVPAERVKGLYDDPPAAAATPSVSARHEPSTSTPATVEDAVVLAPRRRVVPRLVIFVLLVAFVLIGGAPWYQQASFSISMGLLLGTFPNVELAGRHLRRSYRVFFLPVREQRWLMRDFVGIETDVEQRIVNSIGLLVLFFWSLWLMFRVFDHLMPWLGGDYKLWVRTHRDERLLVWQGNSERHFETNLEALQSATGLSISRG